MDLKRNVYKKKNPRTPFIKQIILYSILAILSFVIGVWQFALVFLALTAFAGFMLYRKRDAGSYSLADYIHSYDNEFPTENPDAKDSKETKDKRKQEYENFIAEVEAEYDEFDYGDDEEDE